MKRLVKRSLHGLAQRTTIAALVLAFPFSCAHAGPTSQSGRITDTTFAGDSVLIRLDSASPDNCTGAPYGWMQVPANSKAMQAFVLGLWFRGDAAQTVVTVYTAGIDNGNCVINQIDILH